METIPITTELGALVTAHPELARELERRGLDYCCGGRASLEQACRAAGLDPVTVAAELSAVRSEDPPPEWASMDAAQLVDHLVDTHHRYLWDELPRLAALVTKVRDVHGERHPELRQVAACFEEIRLDLEPHLLKEERVLFPMVRELVAARGAGDGAPAFHCGSVANPISVMLTEHDRVGELLERMADLTGGYVVPPDGCASYAACYVGLARLAADTHLHVHKENNVLFPLVLELEAAARR